MRRALTLAVLLPALALLASATVATPSAQAADPYDVTLSLSRSKAFVYDYVKFRGSVHTASGKDASGTVTIQKRRLPDGNWIDWRTDKLNSYGVFYKRMRMTAKATWEFRAKMPGNSANAIGYSPVRKLTVKGPTWHEAKVIKLVNQQRSKRGLEPVRVRYDLSRAARSHSLDMSRCEKLTHRSSNGYSVGKRVRYWGYKSSGYRYWAAGEDIARGKTGTLYNTPEAIVSAWMGSSAHRAVILKGAFRDIGVGVRTSATSGYRYYTLDMGRRKR